MNDATRDNGRRGEGGAELWYAFGGWDVGRGEARGGGVRLPADACQRLPRVRALLELLHGEGEIVCLDARTGERLGFEVPAGVPAPPPYAEELLELDLDEGSGGAAGAA